MFSTRTLINTSWRSLQNDISDRQISLIDLRSPSEFAKGAIPFAENIPLFDDEERSLVGLTYKEQGQKIATAMGIEMFAQKAEDFLSKVEPQIKNKKLVLHCWRGGMRSQATAKWLRAMGVDSSF